MYKNILLLCGILLLAGCSHRVQALPSHWSPALVMDRQESLPRSNAAVTVSGVPLMLVIAELISLFDSPNGSANGKVLNIFDLVYVHEIKGSDEEWMKASFSRGAGTELGWVKVTKTNAFPWLHRVAFLPRRTIHSSLSQLSIYETAEDAIGALEGKNVSPIGVYDLPTEDRRVALNPWPILEKREAIVEGQKVTAVNVAMLAQKQNPGTLAKSTYTKSELTAMDQGLRSFCVSVLVDNTGSMAKWQTAANLAVKQFIDAFDQQGIDAKFSLSWYRDIDADGSEWYSHHPFESATEFCRRLDSLKADGGGDEPESGYPALVETFNRIKFRNQYSERIMLIVGDSHWHTSGPSNPRRHGNSDVIDAARNAKTKIFVLAVDNATVLASQVSPIARQTGGKTFTLGSTQSLIGEISSILRQGATEVEKIVNVYDAIIRSGSDSEDRIATSLGKSINEIAPIIRLIREVKGIDTKKLAAGEAVALTGWIVPTMGSVSCGTLEMCLFQVEAEEIRKVMQEILRLTPDTTIGPRIWQAAQDERVRNESIGVYFKENFLPYRSTSILSHSLEAIQGLSEANRARIQDEVFPLIRRISTEINEEARWGRLDDGRIRGWISEACLP